MKRWFWSLIAMVLLAAAPGAHAAFHMFRIEQLYSNADGTVQFIVLHECCGFNGENLWVGHKLKVTHGGAQNTYTFPNNLPGGESTDYGMTASPTAHSRVLVATQGFADLNIVAPDYIIPTGFLPTDGGVLDYAESTDVFVYPSLPTDGTNALYRSGMMSANLATNFAGNSASVSPSAPAVRNYEGLWYAAPAESESGWGINFAHQRDIIFATWFTYDLNGNAWWLIMQANKTADGVYQGNLVETHGPAFNTVPFAPKATGNTIGSGTLSFSDANNGTFDYTVNGSHQTKAITREFWGTLPTCVWGAQPDLTLATSNYQDLWYAFPAESESGWGVNFTHQDDIIFATWFTYDFNGNPLWLFASATKTAPGVYTGKLNRTTGPAFNAVPFLKANVHSTEVGTLTITFANGNSASFQYDVTLNGPASKVTQTKTVTREVWDPPGTVCQ